ncbi:Ecl1p Ecym_1414 [Eremothecium cymbalariae DBVPG|uniref:Uncharacterized protein n=1 Tax=Eremothecium cymbalariae (strain CBS 270.75 / DBVPG 7215 / KCTC 17166 / NRRL Y-17582) TaxID=931890 RepID=G8JM71_ERECY|nr:hypothetical protein Ecym_1414 [Eremothecium cymbalariae DBVPG\
MSAFNDYCIVCEQLIEGTGGGCQDKLYCTEECRNKDTRVVLVGLEEQQYTAGEQTESLLRTPRVYPTDWVAVQQRQQQWQEQVIDKDGKYYDDDEEESSCSDLEIETYTTSLTSLSTEQAHRVTTLDMGGWTPRSFVSDGLEHHKPGYGFQFLDHTAENNYQLWLTCKMKE